MNEKINVLVIGMAPQFGGIETFLINAFRNINHEKIRFDFLTFYPHCAFEDEILSAGSSVFHITRRGVNPIKNKIELKKFFKAHTTDYNYVWYHISSPSNIIPIVLAKKYTKAKTVVHCHGTAFESNAIFKPLHLFLSKINFNKMKNNTDYCFACSDKAGDYLFKGKCGDVKIIKNGISTEGCKFNESIRNQVRNELGIGEETVLIGNVGRLCQIKNQDFLIECFAAYKKTNGNSVLAIAGDGEMKNQLVAKAQSLGVDGDVIFLGFRNDLNRLLQAFDLFMLTSFNEGFPISVIEAQTAGLRCLISDSVTKDVAITDLVDYMPLSLEAEKWADKIGRLADRKLSSVDRAGYSEAVKLAGYDIINTAAEVEGFFLENQEEFLK